MRLWGRRSWLALAMPAMAYACSSHVVPPPEPDAGSGPAGLVSTFAWDGVLLGDSEGASWKVLGYDLDDLATSKDSTDVCALSPNAPRSNQQDGEDGRDNSFGYTILPVVTTVAGPIAVCGGLLGACPDAAAPPPLSVNETDAIQQGQFTLQIRTTGLADDPNQSAVGLSVDIFASDALDTTSPPAFDSSTDWPVLPESLADGVSISNGAIAHFASAYVTHGTFVAGTNEDVTVPLHAVINGFAFTLPIHEAIVTFDHVAPTEAANGVLAGVVDPKELIAIFQRIAGRISASLCGSAFDGIADQLAQAADILADRTNRAGTPCTAISFGLGFHARRIANPTKVAAPMTYPDPCAPADGGSDAGAD